MLLLNYLPLVRLRIYWQRMVAILLSGIVSSMVVASERVDLYTASFEVENKSSAERSKVSADALAAIYVKASGDTAVMVNYPSLRRYTDNASRYISSFQYTLVEPLIDTENSAPVTGSDIEADSETNSDTEQHRQLNLPVLARMAEPDERLMLQISFDAKAIRSSLTEAGAPFWQNPRPRVLVWLAVQDGSNRILVGQESAAGMLVGLSVQAMLRGLPLAHPLLDLEEQLVVGVDEVWSMSLNAITAASKRYAADMILVGKVAKTYDQRWMGQWSTIENGQLNTRHLESRSSAEFLQMGVNIAANQLADNLAVGSSSANADNYFRLVVGSVNSANMYMQLVDYLDGVDALKHLRLVQIVQNHCYFEFESSGEFEKIRALLALGGKLQTAMVDQSINGDLAFDWKPQL